VVAVYPVPPQLARLSEAVQRSYSQHGELSAQREPVKNSFRMTLTLVLLLAMLTAIYGAIYSAEKLTRPVQDLIAGTRAVGKGDFGTRLPLPSRDEMGFLVHSFNDMTKRLRRAREETTRSQQAVERERERLSIILARLTTGVIAIGRNMVLRSANHAASSILGVDLELCVGQSLTSISGDPRYARFAGEVSERLARGEEEWREQMDLRPDMLGARVLVCACTPLPGDDHAESEAERQGGYVIVFDDISALLQAQRDAAWGEVARRLAHEIKNPLTPIQLSAERLEMKLSGKLGDAEQAVLTKSVRTIVDQVDAMKRLVNEFRDYARLPAAQLKPVSLNELVTEVLHLYGREGLERGDASAHVPIQVVLDPHCPDVMGDAQQLRQIIHNLLQNAQDATEGCPVREVTIRTQWNESSHRARLLVQDTGTGFPDHILQRAFEPYVTTKVKGTGLGLAVVKKIADEHNARVDLKNKVEDGVVKGAQVSLSFAVAA